MFNGFRGEMCWPAEPPTRNHAITRLLFPSAALALDEAAAEAIVVAATARRKVAARTALAAMLADNAPQAAKDGIAMLRMLVANLVKHPNVPRYRRIATRCASVRVRIPSIQHGI